ncbi:MAG: hypothetical protein K9N21_20455 [Deltaproteobacteria bacterium]|nr:hypothetical protein [Deltaproteobacteria bacterium]
MTPQISTLVNMESPQDVLDEAKHILLMLFPQFDIGPLDGVFHDVLSLFEGGYPGYCACDTQYHDLKHTTDTFLAMARIIHGAGVSGHPFSEWSVALGLISALFHDAGYLLTFDEEGPGARYTMSHIRRSIAFMDTYFAPRGFSREDFEFCGNILNCTGLDVKIHEIRFTSHENEMLGKMLGTADLLGQMADRTYLEKLPFLYDEFKIAGIAGLGSELDFYRNTPGFYAMTIDRFQHELGGVNQYMRHHFRARWGIDDDLYLSAIEESITFLKQILEQHPDTPRKHLRRAGTIRNLERIRGTR